MTGALAVAGYFAVGIIGGVIEGRLLSGKSEEARGIVIMTVFLWPPWFALLGLIGLGFLLSWLLDRLGVRNAGGDNHGV